MRPWGCVINSFAYAADIPIQDLLDKVGHDGSQVVFPTLPEPFNRRGFSVGELTRVLLQHYDMAVVTLNRQDYVYNSMSDYPYMVPNSNLIEDYVQCAKYTVSNDRHMCGVRYGTLYDSRGICTKLDEFNWDTLYLILSLDELRIS